ncbi:MAG: hypothetical protein ABIQ90_17835 [Polaromonas sp.]
MKKIVTILSMAAGLAGVMTLSACTQMPTEKQSISDMRPQISFKVAGDRVHSATVILDGLDMGTVGNYLEGAASLRILSGTHVLSVASGNQIIFQEKFYAGDGVNRTFILK